MTITSKLWMGAVLAIASLAVPAGVQARDIDQQVAADPGGQVVVNNVVGTVNVEAWDKAEVEVTGSIDSGVERVDVVRDGSRVAVRVVLPTANSRRDADADLTIRVPKGSSLDVTTVSADITVREVAGALRLKSVSGEIVAHGAAKDSEFKSVSGDIRVTAAAPAARLVAYSVSGNLVVDDLSGELEATTVSGDLLLDLGTITTLRLRSTSGDARVGGRLAKGARVDFESVSGDLLVKLAADAGFSAEADTFSGSLSNCFGAKPEAASKFGPGERMSLTRGEGSARIRAKTMSGDVRICDR
ncbi:MAG TPA: DUF4097 family beta strand repeat-containing protein [Steroidobacteraceae bacterium]|nr:DUF4097 family beta strand repeat protein [Steroidobacteraceae bacterium]HQW08376.1 DUF4097 family beta strand repeat-containing protein [Steroidobacteraceae bacterium]HQX46772.1 DUF4097 family beta strand repeat-containing protein [Steroidobacteraceae bacterium]HQX79227.1 DUF4097 family beta strand repeat-containing protein [Steroidobacteraceae bacterium]HQZ80379.1 DUF4097 family beta strand repeat-containing protein [Steroidobacteraceae bacterium]